jgi:hypothetical protein
MIRYLITFLVALVFFSGCGASNLLKFGELDKAVATNDKPVRNLFDSNSSFNVYLTEDVEDAVVYLPKENTTVRLEINIANIEDVLYMKLTDESEFNINKLIRRVSDINLLEPTQDGFMFEPSVKKDTIILQVYVPSVYTYKGSYEPTLTFSFKRSQRAVIEKIRLYFIKQKYFVTTNEDDQEVPDYGDLKTYCEKTQLGAPKSFQEQIDKLNQNRVAPEFITKLKGICQ